MIADDLGLRVGGSSGAVVAACVRQLAAKALDGIPVCLCADGGERYASTLFADDWLARRGVLADVRTWIERARRAGLAFASAEAEER
jgi:N-(2-amino-2-carboxyethyl)-L-glutamate synthase